MSKNRIYFIYAEEVNRVKIGKSVKLDRRLYELQCGSPVKLELILSFEAPEIVERKLHALFDQYRVMGEWFEFVEPIRDFILSLERHLAEDILKAAECPEVPDKHYEGIDEIFPSNNVTEWCEKKYLKEKFR